MNHLKLITTFGIILMLTLSSCGCIQQRTTNKKNTLIVERHGNEQYTSIQKAIDDAPENYTVYVYSGLYNETITINKTITLKGENPENTIINGNNLGDVITITQADGCNVTGFTIQNSGSNKAGIHLSTSYGNITNNIFQTNYNGIYASNAHNNIIQNNKFYHQQEYGIYLTGSDNCHIIKNQFINNSYGMRIKARNNEVMQNSFENNERGLYFCCYAEKNLVYHNNFVNNNIYNAKDNYHGQIWQNENLSEGNYWDDYTGMDADGNGIGDTPYNITSDGTMADNYPLMKPYSNQ